MITRFAPSPTGPLHLGHAYSAILAHDLAMREGGTFLLRIEDIDQARCRPEWEAQIYDDLRWLGLWWPEPVMRQSERMSVYADVLAQRFPGMLYDCTCTRGDIAAALSAPQEGATGPDGPVYPGTCRPAFAGDGTPGRKPNAAIRLNMATAIGSAPDRRAISGPTYWFHETGHGPNGETGLITFSQDEIINRIGDVVLARRGIGTSYHLSVVVDDAAQGVTHVVRGEDLFEATKIHVIVQNLLSLPVPTYHHHRLVRDANGKRLAKRDDARAISLYRAEGATPQDIRQMVGL